MSSSRSTLLIGDSRVKNIKSSHFTTKSFPGAKFHFIYQHIIEHAAQFNKTYNLVIVAAGINSVSDKIIFQNHSERRELFKSIEKDVKKIEDALHMSVVFATMVSRELVKVAKAFPSKCSFHYSVITPDLQTSFEQFIFSVNNEIFAAANEKHGMHCAFHADCRMKTSRRAGRKLRVMYDRLSSDGLHPTQDLVRRWIKRVERLVAEH